MLRQQRTRCSAPTDRRRIARQLAKLYTAKNDAQALAGCRDLFKNEFVLDADWTEILSRLDGNDFPQALRDMRDFVARLQRLKQREQALTLAKQVVEYHQQHLGDFHPDTLESRLRVAFLCKITRRLEEAEELFTLAREEAKAVHGGDHPATLRATNQLAVVWRYQGRYEEAARLCSEVLTTRRRVHGDCAATAESLYDMAEVHFLMERYSEAETHYQQRIAMLERIYGSDDPRVVSTERRRRYVQRKARDARSQSRLQLK